MSSSRINEQNFIRKVTAWDWTQEESSDGRGNTYVGSNPRTFYAEIFDVNPFMVVNGVQESMTDYTTIMRCFYSADLDDFKFVTQLFRQPNRTVVNITYQVVRQMLVEQESRYIEVHLSKQNVDAVTDWTSPVPPKGGS